MATKNLGHYVGEVEDIDLDSKEFNQLELVHQTAIKIEHERKLLKERMEYLDNEMSKIREALKEHLKSNEVDWAWLWDKKRTNVKWKAEFVKACGTKKAEEIVNQYKSKTYPQVGIKYIDPIPDSITQIKANPRNIPIVKHKLKLA
jgi:sporulation protein YlmC with PRC-barrel domain